MTVAEAPPEAINADPRTEYVSDGVYWGARARQLPRYIDDITRDFGDDTYEQMMFDPHVRADVNIIKAAVLEEGPSISSAIGDKDADGYDQARDIADFVTNVLGNLRGIPLNDGLWNIADGIAFGNKVAEMVYAYDRSYTGRTQLILDALKVKPRRSTAFVVDKYLNVLGLAARTKDMGESGLSSPFGDGTTLLPREKFAIFTFRPVDNDPRGTTILRAAHSPWWHKVQLWPEYMTFLANFAIPGLIGKTPPNAKQDYVDPKSGEKISPVVALFNTLLNYRNGTVLAVQGGTEIEPLFSEGEGQAFLSAFRLFNSEIDKAIVHQSLATEEGKNGTRAQASVHQDVLETIIRQAKWGMEQMIQRDIIWPLVRYNFGDRYRALMPMVSLGDVSKVDFAAAGTTVAALYKSGYLHDSQLPGTDLILGLPERKEDEGDADDIPPDDGGDPQADDNQDDDDLDTTEEQDDARV